VAFRHRNATAEVVAGRGFSSSLWRMRDAGWLFRTSPYLNGPRREAVEESDAIRRIVTGCTLTAALEVVGERWSFLILRGAFNGLGHFEQFQSVLGIARNILANRLSRLVAHGLMERLPCSDDRRKVEYRLTDKGAALLPALVALRQWGERWAACTPCTTRLVDARDGLPVAEMAIHAVDGRVLTMADMRWVEVEAEAPVAEARAERVAAAG
jgi:DNA-binding HxlR family transcriptional regulator